MRKGRGGLCANARHFPLAVSTLKQSLNCSSLLPKASFWLTVCASACDLVKRASSAESRPGIQLSGAGV